VRENGILRSFFPADFLLPMVSPLDLGEAAARRLTEPVTAVGTYYVEGPERYSARDVADAFAEALDRPVQVEVVPRDQWEAAYRKLGFSEAAAHSYARMTAASISTFWIIPMDRAGDASRAPAWIRSKSFACTPLPSPPNMDRRSVEW